MTLAGTRPILQDELQKYELHHRARIAIKPGITGMWQVSGRSDITDLTGRISAYAHAFLLISGSPIIGYGYDNNYSVRVLFKYGFSIRPVATSKKPMRLTVP